MNEKFCYMKLGQNDKNKSLQKMNFNVYDLCCFLCLNLKCDKNRCKIAHKKKKNKTL